MEMAMRDRTQLIDAPERRGVSVGDFELRREGDTLKLSGYASVFETPYDVFGGPPGGWTEIVDRGAFDRTLREKPDLHLLINHEGMPLARTKSGTLQLGTDRVGLLVGADLDRRDPDVQALEVKMGRGDMDQMSFAFRVKEQVWSEDQTERRLTEVSLHKGDVSVVNFGANDATSATLRSLLSQVADLCVDDALAEVRGDDRDLLTEAAAKLARLRRETTPPEARTLSLAEAMKALDA
jgi:HK97 family phage prohead protease